MILCSNNYALQVIDYRVHHFCRATSYLFFFYVTSIGGKKAGVSPDGK